MKVQFTSIENRILKFDDLIIGDVFCFTYTNIDEAMQYKICIKTCAICFIALNSNNIWLDRSIFKFTELPIKRVNATLNIQEA